MQTEWITEADRFDAMLAPASDLIISTARERTGSLTGSSILDIGCGTAALCRQLSALGAEPVVGVDIDADMIAEGRDRGADEVELIAADASTMDLDRRFDVLVSRFGVMMFDDPIAAFSNLRRHVAPGGLAVLTVWRTAAENEWTALPVEVASRHLGPLPMDGPAFAMADEGRIRTVLDTAGFIDIEVVPFDAPLWVGSDPIDVVGFYRSTEMGRALEALPDQLVDAIESDLTHEMERRRGSEGVHLTGAGWLVTASRRRCA